MIGPFPGPHLPFPHGIAAAFAGLLGVGGLIVGVLVALLALVALAAFTVLLVRFLVVGTKAAELYVARHRDDDAPTAPADAAVEASTSTEAAAGATPKVRAPRTSATTNRAPRRPRTPPTS